MASSQDLVLPTGSPQVAGGPAVAAPPVHDQPAPAVDPADEWHDWAQQTFGADRPRVEAATRAAKSALAAGASAEDAAAAAHDAAWQVWARQRFGSDPQSVEAAVRAAKAAQAAGRGAEEVAAAADAAVEDRFSESWRTWAAAVFPGDETKARVAALEAVAAAQRGASSDEAAVAGKRAAEHLAPLVSRTHPFQEQGAGITLEPTEPNSIERNQRPASRSETSRSPSSDDRGDGVHSSLGVYEYLLQDKSELSQRAVRLIDDLQLSRRPRMIAFCGRRHPGPHSKRGKAAITLFALAWMVIVATHVSAVRSIDGPITPVPFAQALLVSVAVVGLATVVYFWYVATTRYTLAGARLTVESGLLARNAPSYELYRVTNVSVHQSLPNRLTGDGTLLFKYSPPESGQSEVIAVTGLQPYADLESTRKQLMDLCFALRSSPVIQRYMY